MAKVTSNALASYFPAAVCGWPSVVVPVKSNFAAVAPNLRVPFMIRPALSAAFMSPTMS